MAWRIHLTNQAIQNLQILPGAQAVLAIWTRRNRVQYYDLENGTFLSEQTLPSPPNQPRSSTTWQEYAGQLTGPDPAYFLPLVHANGTDIYASDDGKLRLYHTSDDKLFLETEGQETETQIGDDGRFVSLDMDRALGVVVGLDEALRLHIYQQDMPLGEFDLGLVADPDLRPTVVVSRGGSHIYVTDGRRLISLDSSGNIHKSQDLHYFVGRMAASAGGGMIVTSDMESGVLRVYRGESLTLTHQRFAIDLVMASQQIQLLADLPPMGTGISALVAHKRGIFAFAMSGVVCLTDVEQMDEVPRPKALL